MIDLFSFVAAAEAGEGLEKFGLNTGHIIMQVISFSILAFILYRFAFKPVLATIDERQKKIDDGLRYTEEMKAKLDDAESQHKEILQKASAEAQKIVSEARDAAEERISRSTQEAASQAEDILKKAEQQIEMDRKQMLDDARSEIARLVVATAGKVLAKDLSDDEKSRYSEGASASLVDASN